MSHNGRRSMREGGEHESQAASAGRKKDQDKGEKKPSFSTAGVSCHPKEIRSEKPKSCTELGSRKAFTRHAANLSRETDSSRVEQGTRETRPGRKFEVGDCSRGKSYGGSRSYEGGQEDTTYCGREAVQDRGGKDIKVVKQITWADEAGGDLLKIFTLNEDTEESLPASGKRASSELKVICYDGDQRSISRSHSLSGEQQSGEKGRREGGSTNCPTLNRGSFKEALLRRQAPISRASILLHSHPSTTPSRSARGRSRAPRSSQKRCFRCLASDHSVATCRDPVRCFRCGKCGHRALYC